MTIASAVTSPLMPIRAGVPAPCLHRSRWRSTTASGELSGSACDPGRDPYRRSVSTDGQLGGPDLRAWSRGVGVPGQTCLSPVSRTHYLPKETLMAWSADRPSPHNQARPPDWKQRRAAVIARDGGQCHVCGGLGADQADHVMPVHKAGHTTCPTCEPSTASHALPRRTPKRHRQHDGSTARSENPSVTLACWGEGTRTHPRHRRPAPAGTSAL
jgi:5-methylcytosine-specific restriction endonuclease McrA